MKHAGLKMLLELGAELAEAQGDRLAPVARLLQTYCRHPEGKHRRLERTARHGVEMPDTPVMAVHRGRIDLFEEHLRRDPRFIGRTFSHPEIYPPDLGRSEDHSLDLHGTPLAGTILLHISIDFDEMEIGCWLIGHGAVVNANADVDRDGYGGGTRLHLTVSCRKHICVDGRETPPSPAFCLIKTPIRTRARRCASKLRFVADQSMQEYPDVTPLARGKRFHGPGSPGHTWVSKPAMQLIAERGRPE